MPNIKSKRKSLKKRIAFLINLTTFISIFIITVFFVIITKFGLQMFSTELATYYAQELAEKVENTSKDEKVIIESLKQEIDNIQRKMPIIDIYIEKDNSIIYSQIISERYFHKLKFDELNRTQSGEYPNNYKSSIVYDNEGKEVANIIVGVNRQLETIVYISLVMIIAVLSLIVLLVMRIISRIFTNKILAPLNKLQSELDKLADENYENVNPSIVSNKKTVKEVHDLSEATNKLIGKMIEYSELITQSEKMASIGQLTAAITHEINTPLGAIDSNIQMINTISEESIKNIEISDDVDKEDIIETLDLIKDSSELSKEACVRIKDIIKSLRLFSRIDQADFAPSDINESIEGVIILTTNLHKNRITIHKDLEKIPLVDCYIGLINQVFMNIIINAIQAINGIGDIYIHTYADEENVYISIRDTGTGIKKKDLYRIFDYGYTTKSPGSGSGIGLALSNNIINKHNGQITVKTEENIGTEFIIKLPINRDEVNDHEYNNGSR